MLVPVPCLTGFTLRGSTLICWFISELFACLPFTGFQIATNFPCIYRDLWFQISYNSSRFLLEAEKVFCNSYGIINQKSYKEKIMKHVIFAALQGKRNPGTDKSSIEAFLDQVMRAKEMKIDK